MQMVADAIYTSKSFLSRKFKEEYSFSLHEYVKQKRIAYAYELLVRGTPVVTACMESGYNDYITFLRAFKSVKGVLPSEIARGTSYTNIK